MLSCTVLATMHLCDIGINRQLIQFSSVQLMRKKVMFTHSYGHDKMIAGVVCFNDALIVKELEELYVIKKLVCLR